VEGFEILKEVDRIHPGFTEVDRKEEFAEEFASILHRRV